jgi:hypothetical protein
MGSRYRSQPIARPGCRSAPVDGPPMQACGGAIAESREAEATAHTSSRHSGSADSQQCCFGGLRSGKQNGLLPRIGRRGWIVRRRLFSRHGLRLNEADPLVRERHMDERGAVSPDGAWQNGPEAPATTSLAPRDRQQAVVVEMLRRAAGAPVTYAELHDAGIEFPASVVAELELAGVAVERRQVDARGARPLTGVRLDPARDAHSTFDGGAPEEMPAGAQLLRPRISSRSAGRAPSGRARARWLLGVAAVAVLGAAVAAFVPGRPQPRVAAPRRAATQHAAARPHASTPLPAARGATGARALQARRPHRPHARLRPPSKRPDVAQAVDLDLRGHGLLESGRYGAAIPVLRMTLVATGVQVAGCLHPASTACLTYAYALFDLGRALRLSGHRAAAVGLLHDRLQIDNQRSVVELELTRAEAASAVGATAGA